jgi:Skp family chaperone for outer membrane proteins
MARSLLLFCLVFGLGGALRGGEAKVATVDIVRALRAHPDSAEMERVIGAQFSEMEARRDSMAAEQEKMKKAFETARDEALNKALSEAGREERMEIAQRKLAELTDFVQKSRQAAAEERKELADRKARMQRRIVDKIRDSIEKIAAARGMDIVLDSSAQGASGVETLLFVSRAVDMTDAVIAAISSTKSEQAGAGPEKKDPDTNPGAAAGETPK